MEIMKYPKEDMQDTFTKCKLTPEQQQIVTDNYGLVISFLMSKHIRFEDGHNPACIGLCNAVIHHNPSRGKLSTLAYKAMTSEYIKTIRRVDHDNFHKSMISLESTLKTDNSNNITYNVEDTVASNDDLEDLGGYLDLLEVLKSFIPTLTPLQRKIFKLKIVDGYDYKDIAMELNTTYNKINNIYSRQIIPRLKTHMKHCKYETKYLTHKIRNKKENRNGEYN